MGSKRSYHYEHTYDERAIVRMVKRLEEGCPLTEIAKSFGVSTSTIKVRVVEYLKRSEKLLASEGAEA